MDSDGDWMEEKEFVDADYNHLQRTHNITGHREGIMAGKEYILQDAFNRGFKRSISYFEKLSRIRGCFSGLLMYLHLKEDFPEHLCKKIEKLITSLEEMEVEPKHIEELLKTKEQHLIAAEQHCSHIDDNTMNNQRVTDKDMNELSDTIQNSKMMNIEIPNNNRNDVIDNQENLISEVNLHENIKIVVDVGTNLQSSNHQSCSGESQCCSGTANICCMNDEQRESCKTLLKSDVDDLLSEVKEFVDHDTYDELIRIMFNYACSFS